MKVCTNCDEKKLYEDFYKDKCKKDGLASQCKPCRNEVTKRWRKRNFEKIRIVADKYKKENPKRIKEQRERHKPKKRITDIKYQRERRRLNKGLKAEEYRKYREKYPQRIKANTLLNIAIKSGKISRSPCEVCGEVRVHGHHDDYGQPLEVRWLCPIHHKKAHQTSKSR